jgi:hypothetical protein
MPGGKQRSELLAQSGYQIDCKAKTALEGMRWGWRDPSGRRTPSLFLDYGLSVGEPVQEHGTAFQHPTRKGNKTLQLNHKSYIN